MKSRTLRDIARLLNFKMQEYIGKTYTAANAFFMNKFRLIQMFFIYSYRKRESDVPECLLNACLWDYTAK